MDKKKKSPVVKIIVAIIAIFLIVFLSGYFSAFSMHNNGTLSILSAGMKISGMNPISAEGFRLYLSTNTDMYERIDDLNKSLNDLKAFAE